MPHPADWLPNLAEATAEAAEIALAERLRLQPELKADGSVVTNGDRAVETRLRELLPQVVPGTTVWGEEFGWEAPGPNGQWLVDPVDGTSNYSFGSPLWGVSIALLQNGEITLGAIALPDLGETYLGAAGAGVTLDGEPLPAIPEGDILSHQLLTYNEHVLRRLRSVPPGKMRCSGAFVVDGAFAVRQIFRGLIGVNEKLYDVGATLLFARELNAQIRYADGSPFDLAPLSEGAKIPRPWVILPQGCTWTDA